jgi:hypothetical protein
MWLDNKDSGQYYCKIPAYLTNDYVFEPAQKANSGLSFLITPIRYRQVNIQADDFICLTVIIER